MSNSYNCARDTTNNLIELITFYLYKIGSHLSDHITLNSINGFFLYTTTFCIENVPSLFGKRKKFIDKVCIFIAKTRSRREKLPKTSLPKFNSLNRKKGVCILYSSLSLHTITYISESHRFKEKPYYQIADKYHKLNSGYHTSSNHKHSDGCL